MLRSPLGSLDLNSSKAPFLHFRRPKSMGLFRFFPPGTAKQFARWDFGHRSS